jgi:competence protein ComFC
LLSPLPDHCPVCNHPLEEGEGLPCQACRRKVRLLSFPFCRQCGKPLSGSVTALCNQCERKPLPFAAARAGGLYEGVLRACIHLYKYNRVMELLPYLTEILIKGILNLPEPAIDLVVPVPLHRQREWERGFNQASLLAKGAAQYLHKPLATNCLVRIHATLPNSGMSISEREQNLHGAFKVRGQGLTGKSILLVDDIFTTGTTAKECTLALLNSGAAGVYVVTVATVEKHS